MDVCVDRCMGRHLPSSVVPQACRQKVKTQDLRLLLQRELWGAGRETRGVAGTETPLSGHRASVPPPLLAECPSLSLALGSSAPSPNPAHRPAPVGNHEPGQSEWVPIPGSWSLPRATLAWGCSPPGCGLLEGWDGIHPGWDSSLVIQHCQHRAAHLVGVTAGVFSE